MKKLMMFAAAMTIVGGAYAQCSDPEIILGNCMMTYNVKMNLRTVSGKAFAGATIKDPCGETEEIAGTCIRYPKVGLVLEGYLFLCVCDCEALGEATECELFLGNKKLRSMLSISEFGFDWIHILGNGKQAEASWGLLTDGDFTDQIGPLALQGTGFGAFNKKNQVFTSFSGGTTGWLLEPRCLSSCDNASYWLCDGLLDEEEPSVIYGTWAMKLNTKLSGSKAGNNFGSVVKLAFPTWALEQIDFDCIDVEEGNGY